jgi:type II secretory pathway pseudopilin PulG
LVAIVVIGLTIAMIAPPLVISAATRVQNRRAEQSLQIAQGEIDRVRALVTRDQHQPGVIPAVVASVQTYGAPTGASALLRSSRATCNTYTGQQIAANQILRIDVDGDCRADFMMQAFRTAGTTVVGQPLVSEFQMGVRVYSILADNNWNNLGIQQASLKITSGSGNQRTRPLAVLYSNFARSDQGNTLCFYQTGQSLGTSCN